MMFGHFPGSRAAALHFMKKYFTKFLFGVGKLELPHRENMPETPKLNLPYSCVQVWIFVQKTSVKCKQM